MNGAILHTTIITMDDKRRILPDAGMLWENGRIAYIGSSEEVRSRAQEKNLAVYDGNGAYLFPGLINTHNHMFQHLLKGVGTDLALENWWPSTIGPGGRQIREAHTRAAAQGAALELLRTGCTTSVDYFHVQPVPGLSRIEIETVREIGLRQVFGRGFRDSTTVGTFSPKGLSESIDPILEETLGLKTEYEEPEHCMVRVMLAPASVPAMTREGLQKTADFSRERGIPVTLHLYETESDEKFCREKYGCSMIRMLEETGILSPALLAVHCVQMGEMELDAFQAYDVKISHNTLSNMYLASGVAPVPEFLQRGLTVSLGVDGAASNNSNNMLEMLKATALIHKTVRRDPTAMTAAQVLEMATLGGARALGMEREIGSLEVGKHADFFAFDPLRSPTCSPVFDPVASLVYSSDSRGVVLTAVEGKILLKDGEFTCADEKEICLREQELAEDIYRKCGF